ncbi:TrkH family potassium uptake protein [Oscillibacter sp.]|jgi:trk system potassium uptake protein TrkH|uniref:TrkH family potassium uptake protein n=1 Tax=Oscillibacter sp. TaxID=1945593 RepID=UPI00216CF341|nr:TrkH family potassium uptake protein [Oscillibacter sp.]MCI9650069.1 TrkH family potassium uptake protein [Oscillibacter sp.]
MNYRVIGYVIGRILLVEAALMALPLLTAGIYQESPLPFLIPMALLVGIGALLGWKRPGQMSLYARDGLAVVALAWVFMSLFGALPFVLSGDIPNFIDAFFETVSGFTTTGSTILTAVESLRKSSLFWRSFTHWVGGMGVLVFVMAVLPMTDGHGMHLMRAEVPGPTVGKLVSRLGDTAKILYGIYLAMTVLETVLLLAGGMPLFDACVHAFGTAGTGGFSCRDLSVGAYQSAYFDVVIGIFMLLFGVNFNLYYFLLIRRFREVFGSEELRAYLLVVAAAVAAITADICRIYGDVWTSLRHAFFQVSSIITTTGYGTVDFDLWPTFSKSILVTLMFVGACAGSTGGGIKISRILILLKASVSEMKKMLHPNAVATTRLEGKPVSEKTLRGAHIYFTVYMAVFVVSFLLLSIEQKGLVTTFTALAACINNIGPGLEMVGPMGNFSAFSPASKLLLSFDMLVGRLEIFPMLLLFAPSNWRRRMNIRRASRRD